MLGRFKYLFGLKGAVSRRWLVGGWLGGILAKRLKGRTSQKFFASAVVFVAAFVIAKSVVF
jgi:uncharacterized membrane protein YfcA